LTDTETLDVERLSESLRIAAIALGEMRAGAPAFDAVPFAEATRRNCVALRAPDGMLLVVLGNPYDMDTQDWIEQRLREPFGYRLGDRLEIATYLSQQETQLRALDGFSKDIAHDEAKSDGAQDISFESAAEADSTVVRLVTSTLYDALKAGASDVHLETGAAGLTIKYRIDGVLTAAQSVPGTELAEQVISRIKVMSELDIAERRVPQDGRFKARHTHGGEAGRDIDFRVSVMPSVFGEDAVLRILDRKALSDQLHGLTLDSLGFAEAMKQRLRQLSTEPYGMLLVTGPTGSGKTTTLYSALDELNRPDRKIITAEDPVE